MKFPVTRWTAIPVAACLLAAATLSAAEPERDPLRLNPRIRPVTQSLHLWLNPASNTYTGLTRVELEFTVATNRFQFHAQSLELGATTLNGEPLSLTVSTHPPGWVTASFGREIGTGVHVFESSFTNNFNQDGTGLYKAISEGRSYLFTQFEAMYARQAFPCWDEPMFKIPWRVTLTVPENVRAIANMPAAQVIAQDGTMTFEFGRTPPMPSYLVALAIGPFDTVPVPNQSVPGSLVTPAGKSSLAGTVGVHLAPILSALERYFGIPHPFPKLDHLAVPAFLFGAMENVGAITYRDAWLLMDGTHATTQQRSWILMIAAHEMAHQWFGNLVTMNWWDDLWLNEAFATWAGFKIVRQLYPELQFDVMEHEFISLASAADTQPSVRPIRRALSAAANVREAADPLTYFKGMAILTMLENWIGEEPFRSALRGYFHRHAWGNAAAEDLWQAFAEVGDGTLSETLRRYVEQAGIPELTFRRLPGNRLEVSQQRYRTLIAGDTATSLWHVPIVASYAVGSEIRTVRHLLTRAREVIDVPDLDQAEWLHPNSGELGYFLWSLSPEMKESLLRKGLVKLGKLERLGLLQAANFAVASGSLSPVDALQLAQAFANDPGPEVRAAVLRIIQRCGDLLPAEERPSYAAFVRSTLRPMLDAVGFEPRKEETSALEALRSELILQLGIAGEDREVIEFCRTAGRRQLEHPHSVGSSITAATLSVATWHGDAAWSRQLRRAFEAADQPDVRIRFQNRLSAFRDPALVASGLDYALTESVPATSFLDVLAGRPESASTRLTWLEANYGAVQGKISADDLDELPRFLSRADFAVLERARTFFLDPSRRRPLAERRLQEVMDGARLDQLLRERHADAIRALLKTDQSVGR